MRPTCSDVDEKRLKRSFIDKKLTKNPPLSSQTKMTHEHAVFICPSADWTSDLHFWNCIVIIPLVIQSGETLSTENLYPSMTIVK